MAKPRQRPAATTTNKVSNAPRKADGAIYTIPPQQSFMDTLAKGLLDRTADDPMELAGYTILVPHADAARALKNTFTGHWQGKPGILPKITTPGDIDDDDFSLKISDHHVLSETLLDMPPAVSRLQRQLVLASEILKIPGMASSAQKAVKLGGELGRFIDDVQRNDVKLDKLEKLVPENFQSQWARTADFLKIVTETWPRYLESIGHVDPEDRKNAILRIQATYWNTHANDTPVIAAGFTEAAPPVLDLLKTVRALPNGEVVLPAIDTKLDDKHWDQLSPTHPQYLLKNIMTGLDVTRDQVRDWHPARPTVNQAARQDLLREAMRSGGRRIGKMKKTDAARAMQDFDVVLCATPQEEAGVIALRLRQALETEGRTAALVTNDRDLARRVAARMKLWGVDIADSAGTPLADTAAGIYLASTAHMAAENLAPVAFLEAMKHPLAGLGGTPEDFQARMAELENLALHGPRPQGGTQGLKGSLSTAFNRAAARKKPEDIPELKTRVDTLQKWIDDIDAAGKDFFKHMSDTTPQPFRTLLEDHIRFAEALATTAEETGPQRLWRGDDGVKAARFLSELRDAADLMPAVTGHEYAGVVEGLLREVTAYPLQSAHPQLHILTPEQALLRKTDIVALGGLTADVWPPRPSESPWLSPPMAKALGLPPANETSGQSALRFTRLASQRHILMTHAERSGNAPAVASPFLTRLAMTLKTAGLDNKINRNANLLQIYNTLYTPGDVVPMQPPAPTPPVSLRPKKLPVTGVQTLMQDPYAVYARYILKLRPRAPIDASPTAAERGTLIHDALDRFVKKYPDTLPDNAKEELLNIGRDVFSERMNSPTVQSFWWPRFERIAEWFVRFEAERRETSRTLGTEVNGKLDIDVGGEIFTLTAIADRIDRDPSGRIEIIDYKTGGIPSQKSVALGFSPQLTLEAAIAFSGGMDGIAASDPGSLQYWKLSGGRPAASVTHVKGDVAQSMTEARKGIESLVRAFNDAKTPYLSAPRPAYAPYANTYAHLARTAEWSSVKKTGRRARGRKARAPVKRRKKTHGPRR
ncbi:MAG: double-strand break repair protein AddB [Alphaproteobacteria bacterium]|nr:double-strand break repair protein AddB [Alphaproteobacteria bacterium]